MNFLPDELKIQTFPCPNCQQYISSEVDVCKFCFYSVSGDLKRSAIAKELEAKRNINLNRHKNTLIVGVSMILIGLFLIISPIVEMIYSNNINFNCLIPIFIIGGIVITVKGLIGYKDEKKIL